MDANHQEILDNLEETEPRSRLTPYRDLILELRRRHRTYREILQILADRCHIKVSISTLHDFLRSQWRMESKVKKEQTKGYKRSPLSKQQKCQARSNEDIPEGNNVQQRIAAIKKRTASLEENIPCFSYDPTQPLHLTPRIKKSGS